MPRFFVTYPISGQDDKISIKGSDAKHIMGVLRMKPGREITVCDAEGTDHLCNIESFSGEAVIAAIIGRSKNGNESGYEIIVYQGLPKADKMETIIQKCVELGVSKIIPVNCIRSVAKINDKKDIEKKTARWNRIAYEAAKQCNRNKIPEIGYPITFMEAIKKMSKDDLSFLPWESEEKQTIKEFLSNVAVHESGGRPSISFIVGPEGGFDIEEVEYAKKCGIETVSLGKRILRTETVAPSILAMILYEFDL